MKLNGDGNGQAGSNGAQRSGSSGRWDGIERPYGQAEVDRLRG
jgi:hypothetical protein